VANPISFKRQTMAGRYSRSRFFAHDKAAAGKSLHARSTRCVAQILTSCLDFIQMSAKG